MLLCWIYFINYFYIHSFIHSIFQIFLLIIHVLHDKHLYITMSMYQFIFTYHITTFITIIEYKIIKYVFHRLDYLIGREKLTYILSSFHVLVANKWREGKTTRFWGIGGGGGVPHLIFKWRLDFCPEGWASQLASLSSLSGGYLFIYIQALEVLTWWLFL